MPAYDWTMSTSGNGWGGLQAVLKAMLDRIIPADEHGPGAVEAGALRYIERTLDEQRPELRPLYVEGLRRLQEASKERHGIAFDELDPDRADGVLRALSTGELGGGDSDPAFLELVRAHAIEGVFGDPVHGGNRECVGWEMVGYPGPRLALSADEQQLDVEVEPRLASAWAYPIFQRGPDSEERHG